MSLDDVLAAVARLDGKVDANFATIFKQQERHDQTTAEILQRLAGLEKVNEIEDQAADEKPTSQITTVQKFTIGAAIIAGLGGLSAAFEQLWRIGGAMIQALHQAPPPPS